MTRPVRNISSQQINLWMFGHTNKIDLTPEIMDAYAIWHLWYHCLATERGDSVN